MSDDKHDIGRGLTTPIIYEEFWAWTQYRRADGEPGLGFRFVGVHERKDIGDHLYHSESFRDVAVAPKQTIDQLLEAARKALKKNQWLYSNVIHTKGPDGVLKWNHNFTNLGRHADKESATIQAAEKGLLKPPSEEFELWLGVLIAPTVEDHQRWLSDFDKRVLN